MRIEVEAARGNADNRNLNEKMRELKLLRNQLRHGLKEDKERYWNGEAAELEEAARKNDTRLMFAKQKKICKIENTKLIDLRPVKNDNGTVLVKDQEKILQRWSNHFSSVLNRETPTTQPTNTNRKINQVCEDLARAVTREEVKKAVEQTKQPA